MCGSAVQHTPSVQVVPVLAVTFDVVVALSLALGRLSSGSALPGHWCLYVCSAFRDSLTGLGWEGPSGPSCFTEELDPSRVIWWLL